MGLSAFALFIALHAVPLACHADETKQTTFILTDKKTGDPISDGVVEWQLFGNQLRNEQDVQSDDQGKAVVQHPIGKDIRLWVTIRSPNHHPEFYGLRKAASTSLIPDEIKIELRSGAPTTGTVVDQSGQPVPDVRIQVYGPAPKMDNFYYDLRSTKSDAQGNFRLGAIRPDFSQPIRTEHPDFLNQYVRRGFGKPVKIVLVKSQSASGTIVDFRGRPIEGAKVLLGRDRFGKDEHRAITDKDGKFSVKGVEKFPIRLTVTAQKYSPQTREFSEEEASECDFKLLPGRTIRFEIVDVKDQPIQGVRILSDTWQRVRTLVLDARTDEQGRVSFRNAPSDEVEYHILKGGYRAIRDAVLTATKEPHRIVMHRPIRVHGKVVDADSGEPIDRFTVTGGYTYGANDDISWRDWEQSTGAGGEYEHREDEYPDGFVVRVAADGYRPWISVPIHDNATEERPSIELDARLEKLSSAGTDK